jgi:hypothetical protein
LSDSSQYFKSIEQVAKQFAMKSPDTQRSHLNQSSCGINVEKPVLVAVRERQDSASEEMLAIVDNTRLAPPAQSISRATTPDLLPDNMESRFVGLPSRSHSPGIEDLSFDRMSSRIGGSGVVV